MKNVLVKSFFLCSILAISLSSQPVKAAIGLASTGPAATIFLVGGGGLGVFTLATSGRGHDPIGPVEIAAALISIVLLDNPEEQIVNSLKTEYPFLDQSSARYLGQFLNEKIDSQKSQLQDKGQIILDIDKAEIRELLKSTDLLDSELELIAHDLSL